MDALKFNKARAMFFLLFAAYLAIGVLMVFWGNLTGDEGWYTLAAVNVYKGMKPYRDFVFTQMPLFPYVYGLVLAVCGPGLWLGRLFSMLLGLSSFLLLATVARKTAGILAGLIVCALLALNPNFIFSICSVRTQPLTFFLSALGLYFLIRNGPAKSSLVQALVFMNLAFLSRFSMFPALGIAWIHAFSARRDLSRFLLGGLIFNGILLAGLAVFFFADGNLLFGIYGAHRIYCGFAPWKIESCLIPFLKGWWYNEFPMILCLIAAAGVFIHDLARSRVRLSAALWPLSLAASYVAITLIHLGNPGNVPSHQTSIAAFGAVFSAIILGPRIASMQSGKSRAVVAGLLVVVFAAPLLIQQWNVTFESGGSLGRVREAANLIRRRAQSPSQILTFNIELATATGLEPLPGYELGQFSYFFDASDDFVAKRRGSNWARLQADISLGKAQILCFDESQYVNMAGGEKSAGERLFRLIDEKYQQIGVIERYGQFSKKLMIFQLRERGKE